MLIIIYSHQVVSAGLQRSMLAYLISTCFCTTDVNEALATPEESVLPLPTPCRFDLIHTRIKHLFLAGLFLVLKTIAPSL